MVKSIGRLSSGFRINRAADDAAGLGIANQLRADVRALKQAGRNAGLLTDDEVAYKVMQRIAVPMIGGMVSSTALTLIVIPVIYALVKGVGLRPLKDAQPKGLLRQSS